MGLVVMEVGDAVWQAAFQLCLAFLWMVDGLFVHGRQGHAFLVEMIPSLLPSPH